MINNEQSGGSDDNTEYASQWIDYLKKKNAVLNIIWPIFMCLTVLCAISTFYFFQLSESTKQQTLTVLSNLKDSKESYKLLEKAHQKSKQDNIAFLSDAKNELEKQKGDSVSQLDLSSQIVETLKEKIAVLETEKTLITEALYKAKLLLGQNDKDNQAAHKNLVVKTKAHNKERFTMKKKLIDKEVAFKALMSRQKEMQAEMNRLADVVDQQKFEISRAAAKYNTAQVALNTSDLKITNLENKYAELEESIKLAVEPISNASADTEASVAENNVSLQYGDGLEEIRAPVVKASSSKIKTNTDATFDYDRISLDN
jgi:chromosome segregation ATPase